MDVTKPYKFIGLGAMDVTKPYKVIGFGAMDVTETPSGCGECWANRRGARKQCVKGPLAATLTL